jgi:ankyrin repeat protein
MDVHDLLLDSYFALGYSKESKGLCRGVSTQWLEASFLKERHLFRKRINNIIILGEKLPYSIYKVKEKKGKGLTKSDRELLDIQAYYDSLTLFNAPSEYGALFHLNYVVEQTNIETISAYASSDSIKKLGGLTSIYSEPVIGTQRVISNYFSDLSVLLEEAKTARDVFGFILSSNDHAIALTYTPGKGWDFMDINQYPPKHLTKIETKKLASLIHKGFKPNSPYTCFNVSLITTKKNHSLLSPLINKLKLFKNNHQKKIKYASWLLKENYFAHIAAHHGHASFIAELSKHGVDLYRADLKGFTSAMLAAQRGHVAVINALAKHKFDFNKASPAGITAAMGAAQQGHVGVIAELAKHGTDFNKASPFGNTPGVFAAQHGHVAVIAELAKHGVDFNKANNDGLTPAYIAAHLGYVAVIAELAKHGVDFNKATNEGITPAYIAAYQGRVAVIAELAKHGVDFNKVSKAGSTAVYIAAQQGHVAVIAELAKHGASFNKASHEDITPAYIAAQNGHVKVIAELAKHGVDFNKENNGGITPAYIAAYQGHVAVIAELAKHKVDFNKVSNEGITPAYIAAQRGHVAMISELIKQKVDFNIPTTFTAGELNTFASTRGALFSARMAEFVAQQIALGRTTMLMKPYDIARIMGNNKVVKLLMQHQRAIEKQAELLIGQNKEVFWSLLKQLKNITDRLAQKSKTHPAQYEQVHKCVALLYSNLEQKGTLFFNKPDQDSLKQLKAACGIEYTSKIVKKHRGIWYQIHPIIRAVLGVVAALTIIPSLMVSLFVKNGYGLTFFATPKTNSELALAELQNNMREHLKL